MTAATILIIEDDDFQFEIYEEALAGYRLKRVTTGSEALALIPKESPDLLILDHGGGYMSLYAYNEGLLRRVGEKVRAGDPIANVGASGGSADSGLYFELRRDGKPFDPLKWAAR